MISNQNVGIALSCWARRDLADMPSQPSSCLSSCGQLSAPWRPCQWTPSLSSMTSQAPQPPGISLGIWWISPGIVRKNMYLYGLYVSNMGIIWDSLLGDLGVSENSVPLNPMVLLIIIPFLNGYFIGNINPTFSDKPILEVEFHGDVSGSSEMKKSEVQVPLMWQKVKRKRSKTGVQKSTCFFLLLDEQSSNVHVVFFAHTLW